MASLQREPSSLKSLERLPIEAPPSLPALLGPGSESTVIPNFGNPITLWGSQLQGLSERHGEASRKPDFFDDTNDQHEYSFGNIYGHGSFQRIILFLCVLSLVVLSCHTLAFKLIARDVEYWCKRPVEYDDLSTAEWKRTGIPLESDGSYSHCMVYAKTADQPDAGHNRTIVSCDAWEYESASTSIVSLWNLVCKRSWLLSLAKAVFMISAVIGVPTLGLVADHVGRRPVVCGAIVVLLFSGFASCFATSFLLFVIVRCVVSACASIIYITTFILVFEVTSLQRRTLYGTVAASLGIVITNVMFSILDQFDTGWRAVMLIFMAFTAMLAPAFFFIEESPRWLITTRDLKRGEECVLWAAKINGEPLEAVRKEYARMAAEIVKREEALYPQSPTSLMLLTSPTLRVRCASLYTAWFTAFFSYYGLSFTDVMPIKGWAQFANAISFGPSTVMAYFAMTRWGRKAVLAVAFCLVGGSGAALAAAFLTKHLFLNDILLVTAKAASEVSVTVAFIYTAELFPTVLRSAGVCGAYMFGRLGAAAASLLSFFPSQNETYLGVSLILTVGLMFASARALIKLPETLRKSLADTVKEAEQEGLQELYTSWGTTSLRGPRDPKGQSRTLSAQEVPVRKPPKSEEARKVVWSSLE